MQARPRPRRYSDLLVPFTFVAALTLCVGRLTAVAAPLSVGAIELQYGPGWQRADAEEESREESVILRRADATQALTVMLPRHQARLRMTEERFYRQLETVWRAQYGETARVDWLDAGGLRWRTVRRPSLDREDSVVFHLVTVIDGRAHHLLAYAPAATADLPEAVVQLLSGPGVGHENEASSAPLPQALRADLPSGWRLHRVLRPQPGPADLDRVMTRAQRALGDKGGITGLSLEAREQGLRAAVEGYVWVPGPDGKAIRRPFSHQWDLSWTGAPPHWRDGEAATIAVTSGTASTRVRLVIALRYLCGAAGQLRVLLDAAEGGQADARDRIEARFAACRTSGFTQAEFTLGAGETSRPVAIQLPDGYALSAREDGLLVLSLQPRAAEGNPGHALLETAAVHYVYGWGE